MRQLIIYILFTLLAIQLKANDFLIVYTPVDVHSCDDANEFEVKIINTSGNTINNLSVTISQFAGLSYVAGSVVGMTEQNISNLSAPVFSNTAPLAAGDTVKLTYTSEFACANNTFQGANTITINYGGNTYTETSPPYSILFPVLSLANTQHVTPNNYTGFRGGQFTRQIEITNSGTGNLTNFVLVDAHGTSLSITMSPGTQVTNGTTDSLWFTLTDFAALGYPNGLPPGQSIFITETIDLIECTNAASNNPEGASTLSLSTYCNNVLCGNVSTTAQVIVRSPQPDLRRYWDNEKSICYSDNNIIKNRLVTYNAGNGAARSVVMRLIQQGSISFKTYIMPGSIRYVYPDGSPVTYRDSLTELYDPVIPESSCAGGTVHERIVTIPVIEPGDTVIIEFDVLTCCQQSCQDDNIINAIQHQIPQYYYDECLGNQAVSYTSVSQSPGRVDLGASILYTGEGGIAPFGDGDSLDVQFQLNSMSIWPGDSTGEICMEIRFNDWFTVAEPLKIKKSNGSYIIPSSIQITPGNPTIYRACFPIDSFPIPNSPGGTNSVENGGVMSNLNWLIEMSLTASCPPAGEATYVNMQMNYLPSQNCPNPCQLLMECHNQPIAVNCPGCERQGVNNFKFWAKRYNYGLPDNDNDGVPDTTGSINYNNVRTRALMVGDTIIEKLTTKMIINGTLVPWVNGAFPYQDSLHYAYLEHLATAGANNLIRPISLDLELRENGNTHNISLPMSVVFFSGGKYVFDYSIDTLHKYGLPTTYKNFKDGHEIDFYVKFRVTGNVGLTRVPSDVKLRTFMGARTYPHLYEPDTIANDIHNDSMMWRCYGQLPTSLTFYGYRMIHTSSVGERTDIDLPCEREISYSLKFQVGDIRNSSTHAGFNAFPYEYRPWNFLDSVKLALPTGYNYLYSDIKQLLTRYSATTSNYASQTYTSILPSRINGDTLVFYLYDKYTSNPAYVGSNNDSLFRSDDDYYFILKTYLQPRCYTQPDTLIDFEHYASINTNDAWDGDTTILSNLNQYILGPTYSSLINETINIPVDLDHSTGKWDYDDIMFRSPHVETEASLPSISGIDREVCWDVLIENKTSLTQVENVWISFLSPSSNTALTSVIDINTNTTYPVSNGIFQLGKLGRMGTSQEWSKSLKICATYECDPKPDSILILSGWDCIGYPDSIEAYPCKMDTTIVYVYPEEANIQAVLTNQPKIDICDTLESELFVNISDVGTIRDLLVDVTFPSGISFINDSATLEYPVGSTPVSITNPQNYATGGFGWLLDSINNTIEVNGVPGGARDPLNSNFYLRFKMESNCSSISEDPIDFIIRGINNCQDTVSVALSQAIQINGNDTISKITQKISYDSIEICQSSTLTKVVLYNAGLNTFNGTEYYKLSIPNYATISSLNYLHNNLTFDSLVVNGNINDYYYSVNNALAKGDSVVFEFNLSPLTCDTAIIYSIPYVNNSLYCNITSSYCSLSIENDIDSIEVYINQEARIDTIYDTICLLDTVKYYDTICGAHQWYVNGILVSSDSTIDYEVSTSGQTTIRHLVQRRCAIDTIDYIIHAWHLPILQLPNDTTICSYDSLRVDIFDPLFETYLWNDMNTDSIRTFKAVGVYSIIVSDTNGCKAKDTLKLTKFPEYMLTLRDTSVCDGDSITIVPLSNVPLSTYSWNYGAQTNPTLVSYGGKHYLQVTDTNGCYQTDSVEVLVDTLPVPIIDGDTLYCFKADVSLFVVNGPFSTYEWNTGQLSQSILVDSGTYYVEVTDSKGCVGVSSSHFIGHDLAPIPVNDSVLEMCLGDSAILFGGINNSSYIWSTGESTPSITAKSLGIYTIYYSNRCGVDSAEFIINKKELPFFDLGEDQTVCINDGAYYSVPNIANSEIKWYVNNILYDSTQSIRLFNESQVIVNVKQEGCVESDTTYLYIDLCVDSCVLNVPNAFTPDGDGLNDVFLPVSSQGCEYDEYAFYVFNRWGDLIYSTELPHKSWDGKFKGVLSKTDTYVWKVMYREKGKSEKQIKIGHVNLLK